MLRKLFVLALIAVLNLCNADGTRNQGAVNSLCKNLMAACEGSEQSTCQAAKDTGCSCDESQGICTRGNYSN